MIYFSVIIPIFNRASSLRKSIESVIAQSYKDWELIIVDDHSSDNSVNVVKEYQKEDKRITLIELEKNKGPANARNIGIKSSSGKYISLLDSDDWYEPDFLQMSLDKLLETDQKTGFIWTGVRIIDDNGTKSSVWKPKFNKSTYFTFLNELRIGTNTGITIKKEVFDNCGSFDSNLPAAEDTEFFLRISQHYDFDFVKDSLINIDKRGEDRLSKNFRKVALAYNIFIGDHLKTIESNIELQKKYYYKLFWLNYYIPNRKIARMYFIKLMKIKSFKVKVIFLFLVFEIFGSIVGGRIHKKVSK